MNSVFSRWSICKLICVLGEASRNICTSTLPLLNDINTFYTNTWILVLHVFLTNLKVRPVIVKSNVCASFTYHFILEGLGSWVESLWGVELVFGTGWDGNRSRESSSEESVMWSSSALPASLHLNRIINTDSTSFVNTHMDTWQGSIGTCLLQGVAAWSWQDFCFGVLREAGDSWGSSTQCDDTFFDSEEFLHNKYW